METIQYSAADQYNRGVVKAIDAIMAMPLIIKSRFLNMFSDDENGEADQLNEDKKK